MSQSNGEVAYQILLILFAHPTDGLTEVLRRIHLDALNKRRRRTKVVGIALLALAAYGAYKLLKK